MLDLIQAYENYLTKVKHASGNTVASYMRDIRQFADWLQLNEDVDILEEVKYYYQEFYEYELTDEQAQNVIDGWVTSGGE